MSRKYLFGRLRAATRRGRQPKVAIIGAGFGGIGMAVALRRAGIDDLVKRVIALPGETVTECQSGRVCIDGRLLDEGYLPDATTTTINGTIPGCEPSSPENGCTVPASHYFVMGDNRGQSADARIHGPIKGSSIVGRVFVRIWPLDRLGFL